MKRKANPKSKNKGQRKKEKKNPLQDIVIDSIENFHFLLERLNDEDKEGKQNAQKKLQDLCTDQIVCCSSI